jgi:hypothetical protein
MVAVTRTGMRSMVPRRLETFTELPDKTFRCSALRSSRRERGRTSIRNPVYARYLVNHARVSGQAVVAAASL